MRLQGIGLKTLVAAAAIGVLVPATGTSAEAAGTAKPAAAGVAAMTDGPTAPQRVVAEGDGWIITTDAKNIPGLVRPATTVDCGVVRCTLYLTRSQTKSLNNNINLAGGGIGGLAASCGLFSLMAGPAGPVVATVCGVEVLVYGGFMLNAVSRAAGDNGCFAVSYGLGGFLFYDNNSSFCKN